MIMVFGTLRLYDCNEAIETMGSELVIGVDKSKLQKNMSYAEFEMKWATADA
jgi:hypothetical protein